MATTTDEIKIDFDEIDRLKAEEAKKDDKNDDIEIIKADAEPKSVEKTVLKPEDGLENLKKQLEDERTARANAERHAREASEAEVKARTEVHGSQLDLITNAIASLTQASDTLESKYAEALAAQDHGAAAKVQREMATNAARLMTLEDGKQRLEKAPKPTIRPPSDAVDEFASRLSPKSADWVRAHPEYVRDQKKNRMMLAAHGLAMDRGHQADSDSYFQDIERTLDIAQPDSITEIEIDPMKDAAKPVRRAAPAAAPVTRSGNGAGSRPNVVTLSAMEVEMAHMNFPDSKNPEQDYARAKMALKKEGRLN
jgi:hypothetical protein